MKRTHVVTRDGGSPIRTQEYQEANVPILGEVLFAAELVLLHAAPLYYGLGIPHGDGSAVILLPAFLCPDAYLTPLHQWLARIGYKPFFSVSVVRSYETSLAHGPSYSFDSSSPVSSRLERPRL